MEAPRFRGCKDGAAITGGVMALTLALSGASVPVTLAWPFPCINADSSSVCNGSYRALCGFRALAKHRVQYYPI